MRGALPAFFAIAFLLVPPCARADASLFPRGRVFPVPVADPREPRFGFDWVEGGRVSAFLGRDFALARVGACDVRVDGMLRAWLRETPGFNFPLETVDGSFGMALEARRGALSGRLRYGHLSSHRADGVALPNGKQFVYSRETASLLGAWTGARRVTAYAGPMFMLRGEPDAPAFQLQAGGELRLRSSTGLVPYVAADFRIKSENANRVNQSYELGVRLLEDGAPALRVAAGYTCGISERGQLWKTPESFFHLGLTLGD
jgi:hypothetical protein